MRIFAIKNRWENLCLKKRIALPTQDTQAKASRQKSTELPVQVNVTTINELSTPEDAANDTM
jgi:hypothetical protein